MAKYLDESGFGHFWNKAKKYIDEKDIISDLKLATSTASFDVIVRKLININDVVSAQGFCIFGDNGEYAAVACPTASDASTYIVVFDTRTNAILSSTEIPLGHANTLSCLNNVIVGINTTNTTAVFIDVSDPVNPIQQRTLDLSGSVSAAVRTLCWYDENTLLGYSSSDSYFSFYLVDALAGTLLSSFENAYENTFNVLNQGIATDDSYVYLCLSSPNTVLVFDKEDFTFVDLLTIPSNIGYIDTTELEQIYIYNGVYYFAFSPHGFKDKVLPCIAKYSKDEHPIILQRENAANTISVSVSSANGNEIVKSLYPNMGRPVFKFLEDALNYAPNARKIIYIEDEYQYNTSIYNQNILFIFQPNSTFTGNLDVFGCYIDLRADATTKFATGKASNDVIYGGQTAQFRFSNCNVRFSGNLTNYDYASHLITYSEFTFAFISSDVKVSNASENLRGFIARNSVILANYIDDCFIAIDNTKIVSQTIKMVRDRICFISPSCSVNTTRILIGNTASSTGLSIDITSTESAIVPYIYAMNLRSGGSVSMQWHLNTAINNTGDFTDVTGSTLTARGDHTLRLDLIKISKAAWPVQLTGSTIILYGATLTLTNCYALDGTALSLSGVTKNMVSALNT